MSSSPPPWRRQGPGESIHTSLAAAGTLVCVMVLFTLAQFFMLPPVSAVGLVLALAILIVVPGNTRIDPGARRAHCLFGVAGVLINGFILFALLIPA